MADLSPLYGLGWLFWSTLTTLVIVAVVLLILRNVLTMAAELRGFRGGQERLQQRLDAAESVAAISISGLERVAENESLVLAEYPKIVGQTTQEIELAGLLVPRLIRTPDFEAATLTALARGVSVRVLLSDPASSLFRDVETEPHGDRAFLCRELKSGITTLERMVASDLSGRLELRLSWEPLPSLMLIEDRQRVYFAPYLGTSPQLIAPVFQFSSGSSTIARQFVRAFGESWSAAAPAVGVHAS